MESEPWDRAKLCSLGFARSQLVEVRDDLLGFATLCKGLMLGFASDLYDL